MPSTPPIIAVLLAAGGGTRMQHKDPKTLHELNGKPMVSYGVSSLCELDLSQLIAVVGVKAKKVSKVIKKSVPNSGPALKFAHQKKRLGTADAVRCALEVLDTSADTNSACLLVMPADAPLITSKTLQKLVEVHIASKSPATLLTAEVDDPTGYGRIIRNEAGKLQKIVEHKDANAKERSVNEICTSIYCFSPTPLAEALAEVTPLNAGGEYYLTDVVGILIAAGHELAAYTTPDPQETAGVNTPEQFEKASQCLKPLH